MLGIGLLARVANAMTTHSARDVELHKLHMAARITLEDAFQAAYARWRLAGNATTVRECIADESADALALCRQMNIPVPEVRR